MEKKQHFYWLDLIRFLAALAVVVVHARGEAWETYSLLLPESKNAFTFVLYAIISQGFTGVIVFFVLSGFLVGGRTAERIANGTANIRQYCIDRGVRIGLPLIGSLALIALVDLVLQQPTDWPTMAGNLFALQGIFVGDVGGVFWTLSYEIWFYVLFGGLIIAFNKRIALTNRYLIGGGITVIALTMFTVLETHYLFVLLIGAGSYYFAKQQSKPSNFLLILSALLFLMFVVGIMLASESRAFDMSLFHSLNKKVITVLLGFATALFLADVVKRAPSKKWSIVLNDIGTKLSIFSYSLYLTHWQVLRLINHFWGRSTVINSTSVLKLIATILACIIFSYIFYLLTERNTNLVKGWIKSKL